MKNLILGAAIFAFAGLSTVKASENKVQVNVTVQQDSTTKTAVQLNDLPDAVKATLASDKYKDWTPSAAYLVTDANKAEYYLVEVKKGNESASVKIGKDGVITG